MRIIGGEFKGREIQAPKTTGTRPMTDKDREAVFNILGDIQGLKVLDAYAGSGALGLEALSRGATQINAIEIATVAVKTIRQNVKKLDVANRYLLHHTSVESWLMSRRVLGIKYDLIFADPPFDKLQVEIFNQLGKLLESGGLLILKHSSRIASPELDITLADSRRFGDTTISFYRK